MANSKLPVRTLADVIRALLPAPLHEEVSDKGVLLTAGDPGLVTVRISNKGLVVSVFGIRWNGPSTPTRADRKLCNFSWDELPAELPEQTVVAAALIQAAIVVRRAKFRICRYCQSSTPPESQHEADVCHGCASCHLGIVY